MVAASGGQYDVTRRKDVPDSQPSGRLIAAADEPVRNSGHEDKLEMWESHDFHKLEPLV